MCHLERGVAGLLPQDAGVDTLLVVQPERLPTGHFTPTSFIVQK